MVVIKTFTKESYLYIFNLETLVKGCFFVLFLHVLVSTVSFMCVSI